MITKVGQLSAEELQRFRQVCAMRKLVECGHRDLNAEEAAAAIVAWYEFMDDVRVRYDLDDGAFAVSAIGGLISEES